MIYFSKIFILSLIGILCVVNSTKTSVSGPKTANRASSDQIPSDERNEIQKGTSNTVTLSNENSSDQEDSSENLSDQKASIENLPDVNFEGKLIPKDFSKITTSRTPKPINIDAFISLSYLFEEDQLRELLSKAPKCDFARILGLRVLYDDFMKEESYFGSLFFGFISNDSKIRKLNRIRDGLNRIVFDNPGVEDRKLSRRTWLTILKNYRTETVKINFIDNESKEAVTSINDLIEYIDIIINNLKFDERQSKLPTSSSSLDGDAKSFNTKSSNTFFDTLFEKGITRADNFHELTEDSRKIIAKFCKEILNKDIVGLKLSDLKTALGNLYGRLLKIHGFMVQHRLPLEYHTSSSIWISHIKDPKGILEISSLDFGENFTLNDLLNMIILYLNVKDDSV